MNENLTKLRDALQIYLDAETPDRADYIRGVGIIDINSFIEGYHKIHTPPITNERAKKLRQNLLHHKELCNFHYVYHLKKDMIRYILEQYKDKSKLVWDIVELPAEMKENDSPLITFALGSEDSQKRELVLDLDTPKDITNNVDSYIQNFENSSAKIFDKCFEEIQYGKKNTRTIYIKNDQSFVELCKAALNSINNELYIETCIVSFDVIDLITGVSPYNFFSCGQFSFFEKVTDDTGKILFSNLTIDLNQDVNPTRPPY